MTIGVYKIRNKISGKVYIGSSVNIESRWRDHRATLNSRTHNNRYLTRAWHKYGKDAFEFTIVEVVENEADLIQCEQKWIDTYESYSRRKGYNISKTAYSILGYKFTEEQKQKVAAALRGVPKSDEHRSNIWKNRKVTDEQRKRMSEIGKRAKGRKITGVHSLRKSEAQRGSKNPSAKYSEEQVINVRKDLANHLAMDDIASRNGMTYHAVYEIRKNLRWTHIRLDAESEKRIAEYNGRASNTGDSNHNAKLTVEKVKEIKRLLNQGEKVPKIAEMFGVGKSTIGSIKYGKTWKHV